VFTSDDIFVTGDRVFAVHSPDSGNTYEVDFGHDDGMPFCACEDWRRYHWPCKHFCACFQQTVHGWDDLVGSYRDSPYFTVDTDVIQLLSAGTSTLPDTVGADSGEDADDVDGQRDEVAAVGSLGSAEDQAVQCREVLRQLIDATYLSSDSEQLAQLRTWLINDLAQFRQHLPADAGLNLNVTQSRKRRAPRSGRLRLRPLHVRRSTRRRVGASQVPRSSNVDVELSPSHHDAVIADADVVVQDEVLAAEPVIWPAAYAAPHVEARPVTCDVGVSAPADTDSTSADVRPQHFTPMKLRRHPKKVLVKTVRTVYGQQLIMVM